MKKDLFLLAALPMVATSATAKTHEPIDTLAARQLQEVQVLSTRANSRMPLAFQNLSKEDIKAVNYGQDVPYLLSFTPSVITTSDAGNGIGYTTLRVRGTDPSRINITANGVPMNDAESSQLFWVNFGDFASSAQSMQIQRGVGTSTNGAGAFGATVNMQTEGVGTRPTVGLDLSAGSYYSHKETLRFSTGLIADHWGLQGRLSNIGSKGYIDRASTKLNSYFLQAGYYGDKTQVKLITYNGEEQTYHAWNYTSKYEQSLYGRTYNSCGVYWTSDGEQHYYNGQTDNYHSQNFQLIWNQTISPLWTSNVTLHYTRGDGYYEEYKYNKNLVDYGLSTTKFKTDLIRQKKMGNDFYGAIASFNFDNKHGLTANIGAGWNQYVGNHFGKVIWVKEIADVTLQPEFEYYRNKAKKADFNIYGKVTYEFLKGLNGFLDLQYRNVNYKLQDPTDTYTGVPQTDYILTDDFNFFNPKLGLTYDITPHHRVYASYAISHKEPVRNNYKNNYLGNLDKPKAERLGDLEVGYKFQSQTFTAGVNFYYMNYKDQLVLTGELDDIGEAVTRNVDKSYRLGVEMEAAWKPVDWFQWDINATWSRNRVKDVQVTLDDYTTKYTIEGWSPLSYSPDLTLSNVFTFRYKGFRASLQSQYISDQYLTNTGFKTMACEDENHQATEETLLLKKHFVTNLDLSYNFTLRKFGLKDATIGVTLYNLTAAEYDNNGWAAPQYKVEGGKLTAYNAWNTRDRDAAGFAPSAPFNFMAHLSLNF